MGQRFAILAAVGVAAFAVVFLGALTAYVALGGPANAARIASQAAPSSTGLGQAQGPAVVPGQPGTGQDPASPGSSASYPISPDEAVNIALNNAPGASLVQQPRLVSVNGTAAYEIALDRGNVYVDATNGQVLYGQAAPRTRRGRR